MIKFLDKKSRSEKDEAMVSICVYILLSMIILVSLIIFFATDASGQKFFYANKKIEKIKFDMVELKKIPLDDGFVEDKYFLLRWKRYPATKYYKVKYCLNECKFYYTVLPSVKILLQKIEWQTVFHKKGGAHILPHNNNHSFKIRAFANKRQYNKYTEYVFVEDAPTIVIKDVIENE